MWSFLWWVLFGLNLELSVFVNRSCFPECFCGLNLVSWVFLRTKLNFLGVFGLKLLFFGVFGLKLLFLGVLRVNLISSGVFGLKLLFPGALVFVNVVALFLTLWWSCYLGHYSWVLFIWVGSELGPLKFLGFPRVFSYLPGAVAPSLLLILVGLLICRVCLLRFLVHRVGLILFF